jgi:DNA-binding CsgD family transcriptional regulator
MWVKLADQPRYVAAVSLQRPECLSDFGNDELKLLIALKPHMQQMLRISQKLRGAEVESALLSAKLEEMDVAICLIRADGSIGRLSPAAEAVLNKRSGIWIRNGRLEASSMAEQRTLNALIAAACSTAQGCGTQHPVEVRATSIGGTLLKTWTALAGGAMLITRNPPLRPLQVVVSPFCSAGTLNESHAVALVQFSDPSAVPQSRSSILRALFALTPTESRLTDLLAQGLELREAADQMKITFETARFNVKRVLAKTGARRQTELVRMMLSLPGSSPAPPIRSISSDR